MGNKIGKMNKSRDSGAKKSIHEESGTRVEHPKGRLLSMEEIMRDMNTRIKMVWTNTEENN